MKIALCTRIRRANRFIKEYIDYYLNLGVDTIFIGDNNRQDDQFDDHNVKEYLKEYIDNNKVVYVDISKFKNAEKCHDQFERMVYKDYENQFDYVMPFDYDEFLNLNGYFKDIKEWLEYLNTKKNVEQVILNWNIKIGSKQIDYEPTGKFLETYSYLKNQPSQTTKSITKTKLKTQLNNHAIFENSTKLSIINADGNDIYFDKNEKGCINIKRNCISKKITFDHYKFTSIERYVQNRLLWLQTQLPSKQWYACLSYILKRWELPKNIVIENMYKFSRKYGFDFDLANDICYIPDINLIEKYGCLNSFLNYK